MLCVVLFVLGALALLLLASLLLCASAATHSSRPVTQCRGEPGGCVWLSAEAAHLKSLPTNALTNKLGLMESNKSRN